MATKRRGGIKRRNGAKKGRSYKDNGTLQIDAKKGKSNAGSNKLKDSKGRFKRTKIPSEEDVVKQIEKLEKRLKEIRQKSKQEIHERIKLSAGKIDEVTEAARQLQIVFGRAKDELQSDDVTQRMKIKRPLDIKVRIFQYADGSVDGELLIRKIPRGLKVQKLINEIGNKHFLPGTKQWLSIGLRHSSPEGVKSADSRYRGLVQANTYYSRFTKMALQNTLLSARTIDDNMTRKRRHKPEQIFVRIHWNPTNRKPRRY